MLKNEGVASTIQAEISSFRWEAICAHSLCLIRSPRGDLGFGCHSARRLLEPPLFATIPAVQP